MSAPLEQDGKEEYLEEAVQAVEDFPVMAPPPGKRVAFREDDEKTRILVHDEMNRDVTDDETDAGESDPLDSSQTSTLKEEISRLRLENDSMKQQSKLMRRASLYHRKEMELDSVRDTLSEREKEFQQSRTKLDREKRLEIHSYELELGNAKRVHAEEVADLKQRLRDAILSMSSDGDDGQNYADLHHQISVLESAMENMANEHAEDIENLIEENEREVSQLRSEYSSRLSTLESAEMDRNARIRELTEENRRMKSEGKEIGAMKSLVARIQTEKENLQGMVEELKGELVTNVNARGKLESDLSVSRQLLLTRSVPGSPAMSSHHSSDSHRLFPLGNVDFEDNIGSPVSSPNRPRLSSADSNEDLALELSTTLSSLPSDVSPEVRERIKLNVHRSISNLQQVYDSKITNLQDETEGEIESLIQVKQRMELKLHKYDRDTTAMETMHAKEKSELEERVNALESRVRKMRETHEWQTAENEREMNKLSLGRQDNASLITELETHVSLMEQQRAKDKERILELEELNESFEAELENTELDIELYTKKIEHLTQVMNEHNIGVSDGREATPEAVMELFRSNEVAEASEFRHENDFLRTKLDEMSVEKEKSEENHEREMAELGRRLAETTRMVAELQATTATTATTATAEQSTEVVDELREEVAALTERNTQANQLERQVAELQRENERLKATRRQVEQQGGWFGSNVFCSN